MASASGDDITITTGVICSVIHCLMPLIAVGPKLHSAPGPPQDAPPLLHCL
jgi:hypothetical protein